LTPSTTWVSTFKGGSNVDDHVKPILDSAAVAATIATVVGWLPAIAAALSIIWTAIRIYESRTVQQLITRWKK